MALRQVERMLQQFFLSQGCSAFQQILICRPRFTSQSLILISPSSSAQMLTYKFLNSSKSQCETLSYQILSCCPVLQSSGKKHGLRKTAYLPNRTCVCWCKLSNTLDLSLRSPNIFCSGASSVRRTFLTPKPPQKRTLKTTRRPLLINVTNVRVLAPQMFSIELWRQWQSQKLRLIQASDGALRSVNEENRNVVIRVRGYRMTDIQE